MSTITLPYTLTNGNNNDATQVMADFNAITGVVNGFIDATNISAAYTAARDAAATTAANLAVTNAANNHLKLFTVANLRFKYGTGTSGTLDSTAGRSKATGTIAHGLGGSPVIADCVFSTVGVTEAAGSFGLAHSVIWDATNITWTVTSVGTSNNGFSVTWWAIG